MPAFRHYAPRAHRTMRQQSWQTAGRWLLLILLLLPTAVPAAALNGKERVLVLNSYHQGYTWSDNETAGIVATLKSAGITHDPEIEYLDAKHLPKQEHFPLQRNLLQAKLTKVHRPNVVLTLDDPAFDFAVTYRQQLFAGIPIVFIGKNDYSPAMLRGEQGITGAVERQDFLGTVGAALQLQPQTREVVVVHDYTPSGLLTRVQVAEQLAPLASRITVRYLPPMTIDEVLAELKKLKAGSIVLAVSFGADMAGRVFNHETLAKVLSESVPVPVYSTKEERLGFGIVGGSLMEGRTHGVQGAELALRILRGEAVDTIPVVEVPRSELMFDYRQLQRFQIPLERLPAGSTVINRPQSVYAQHRQVINVAALIIGILTASLAAIIIANRRRKKAEAEIFETRSYQALFDNASDPLFILDGHGRIRESSHVAHLLLHRSAEALQQCSLAELVAAADGGGFQAHLVKVREDGQGVFTTAFVPAYGEAVPVEISSRAIIYRGEAALLCAARDISERVQYAQALQGLNTALEERIRERTLELEVANRELESFCYSVSHDLQAPLRHINSFCTMLTEDHAPSLNDDANQYLARICRASSRMGQLIEDLLNLSRISRTDMTRSSVNLSALGREIREELSLTHPEREVSWQVADGLTATGDPQLLRIALSNLLENAWKYCSKTAAPRIEFGRGISSSGGLAFFVRDNGAGFDMQYASKLFIPFQRLHHEREFPGTGIGLATVARIIHRHGGQIWAEAEENRGATFWFTLG